MLNVSEIFESVQGEGPNIGRPSTFLRLARCNQHCIWCDTSYTWRFDESFPHNGNKVYDPAVEIKQASAEEVFLTLKGYRPAHLVITGGEPMLQWKELVELLALLAKDSSRTWSVEVETAGTVKSDLIIFTLMPLTYVVSPKLANSGNEVKLRYRPLVLDYFNRKSASFKFVVATMQDLYEVNNIVSAIEIDPARVYIMPEGIDAETIGRRTSELTEIVIQNGYRLTTRLQVLAWGNRRGV